jgi:rhodanese-related sulfurtransferase
MNYRTYHISFGMIFLMVGLVACGPASLKKTGVVVINVLDKELYDDCHIKGSIHIPFEMIEQQADAIDKTADIVIYCSNYQCATSEYAARKLCALGFTNVSIYEGGMAEWFQQGLPCEGSCTRTYLKRTLQPVPHENNSAIPIITALELAQKMGLIDQQKKAA